jgi:hypothetical protein
MNLQQFMNYENTFEYANKKYKCIMYYRGVALDTIIEGKTKQYWKGLLLVLIMRCQEMIAQAEDQFTRVSAQSHKTLTHYRNVLSKTALIRGISAVEKTDDEIKKVLHLLTGTTSVQMDDMTDEKLGVYRVEGSYKEKQAEYEGDVELVAADIKRVKNEFLLFLVEKITWGSLSDDGEDGLQFITLEEYEQHGRHLCSNYFACPAFKLGLVVPIMGKCSACHTVAYCSVDCQHQHWKTNHKRHCPGVRGKELLKVTF